MSADRDAHSLPAVHALHLAELVSRWEVGADALFDGLGLRPEKFADPGERLTVTTVERLVERARALTGEPGLGIYLGLQMQVSAHGFVGLAAMTSASVREALELATRFAPTRTTALGLHLQVERGVASVRIDEHADFGTARDVVVLALVLGLARIASALTGRAIDGAAEFAFEPPAYLSRFANAIPARLAFGRPAHRLVFDAAVLDVPLTMADPAALRLVREQCERELDALGYGGRVADRVRSLAARDDGGFHSLEEVAARMHVSPRTLKRRLAADGAAYSAIVDDERRERALVLLRSSDASLEAVAERAGYSDVANFTRAFRRWTGTTPAAWRRER